jgi:catechol 2,3-dioxygenase-like lactoylglutathione lyase family enzyme
MSVTALRSVEFGVADLDASVRFYEDVWGLEPVCTAGGAVYLRGSGPEHHVVVLRRNDEAALLLTTLAAPDRPAVDALYERVSASGVRALCAPGALDAPGGGYGFAFADLEGRRFVIACDVTSHERDARAENRPSKLSHLVLNCADVDAAAAFFRETLGFRLRDQTARMDFLGCNPDHHSLALVRTGHSLLNHVAFEVPDLNSLMRGSARVRRAGTAIEWGVGRHGPGNNIFAYFLDPSELPIEYTTEVQQVDDATYRRGTPNDWKPPIAGNPDYWGFAAPPSERFEHASNAPHRAPSLKG